MQMVALNLFTHHLVLGNGFQESILTVFNRTTRRADAEKNAHAYYKMHFLLNKVACNVGFPPRIVCVLPEPGSNNVSLLWKSTCQTTHV